MAADVRAGDVDHQELTIFAHSSGATPSAIAVVRVSGPVALAAAGALCGSLPPAREARVRRLSDPVTGELLDRGLVLALPGPLTATGEDVVELHCHGSRAVLAAVERALGAQPGCRRAEPGEFTRRALRNGVIDLTQAEALGELLQAETQMQRRLALRGAEGALGQAIARWQTVLVRQAALIEAALAFEDEEEVAAGEAFDHEAIADVVAEMIALLAAPPVERVRDGIRVVLAGPPNAGKSTLLNVLAGRDAAIVSPHAGTTRDRIEAPVQRDGIAYVLIDTAGLRSAQDEVEAAGIARAEEAIGEADVVLWLGDEAPPAAERVIALGARSDEAGRTIASNRLGISALTGAGMAELWSAIHDAAVRLLPSETGLSVNRRQRGLVSDAISALHEMPDGDLILAAEALRVALRSFDRITGRAGVEDVVDALFSTFCLGK